MTHRRSTLALPCLLTLVLSISLAPPAAAEAGGASSRGLSADDLSPADAAPAADARVDDGLGRGTEPRTYLVQLRDAAVPTYDGGVDGFAPSSADGSQRFDDESAPARSYEAHLVAEQGDFVARAESRVGHDVEVAFTYQHAVNGLAVVLTPDEARQVAGDPEVVSITPDVQRELHTDSGPEWIDAELVWGENPPSGATACTGPCGEGIVIGVIDTGISPANPSFADPGGDGYDHTNPLGAGNYVGVCDDTNAAQYDPLFTCNDKLIGAWGFLAPADNNAVDYDGHGSHTASTAGGNVVNGVAVTTDATPPFTTPPFDISGVAPHANIIAYLGLLQPVRADRLDQPGDPGRGRRHQLLHRLGLAVGRLERLRHGGLPQRPCRRHLRRHLQRQRRAGRGHHRLTRGRTVAHLRRRHDPRPPQPQRAHGADQQRRTAGRHRGQVRDRGPARSGAGRVRGQRG